MTIAAPKIEMPVKEARELYRKYREHQHYSQPIDDEVRRTYQLIAQGKVVIRALEAIKSAGLNASGFPVLAIVRADAKKCYLTRRTDGSGSMSSKPWDRSPRSRSRIPFGSGTFPWRANSSGYLSDGESHVPTVPLNLRPKRGIANYYILWEAEWTPIPPQDPLLLRRIGKADLWLVVAAWDLTPVEQAALAGRMNG